MDRSSSPWRVLDDAASGTTRDQNEAPDEQASSSGRPVAWSWRTIGGVALAAGLAAAAFVVAANGPGGEVVVDGGTAFGASPPAASRTAGGPSAAIVVVDVQGAVLHPGVIRLVAGARVGDAIEAAGGFGPRVDAERAGLELNLAAALADGDRIVVPSRDHPPGSGSGSNPGGGGAAGDGGGAGGGLVDLNAATASELDALPGIGPVTAKKIIDARAETPFASVDDLRDRKLVGASVFEKIHDLVTVR
jgi:competence protein ComEA